MLSTSTSTSASASASAALPAPPPLLRRRLLRKTRGEENPPFLSLLQLLPEIPLKLRLGLGLGLRAALQQCDISDAADGEEQAAVDDGGGQGVGDGVAEHGAHHAGIVDVTALVVTLFE